MPFGSATVVTNRGKAIIAKRLTGGASPVQVEPKFLAVGVGANTAGRTAAVTDTSLSSEVQARVGTNAGATDITDVTDDTYVVTNVVTASAHREVNEAALFDTGTANSGNTFISATFPPVNLESGDSIQVTFRTHIDD